MLQDVTVLYQGGSGGFLLFYYLLLSGCYTSGLPTTHIESLIESQFPLTLRDQPQQWKLTEHWPDNQWCKLNAASPKLYFVCNPCWNADMLQRNLALTSGTVKYLLYTDISTQLRLAYDKKAHWFTEHSRKTFCAPTSDYKYIRQIIKSAKQGVDPLVHTVIEKFSPDYIIRLQDFLHHPVLPLQADPNQHQLDFVARWVSLQTPKSQTKL